MGYERLTPGKKIAATAAVFLLAAACQSDGQTEASNPAEQPAAASPSLGAMEYIGIGALPGTHDCLAIQEGEPFALADGEVFNNEMIDLSGQAEQTREMINTFTADFNRHLKPEYKVENINTLLRLTDCQTEYAGDLIAGTGYYPDKIDIVLSHNANFERDLIENIVRHEQAHLLENQIWDSAVIGSPNEAQLMRLEENWFNLLDQKKPGLKDYIQSQPTDGFGLPLPMDVIIGQELPVDQYQDILEDDNSVFQLFDESSYTDRIGGHPYSNPSELFASGVNLALEYPLSFLANAKEMSASDQKLAQAAMKTILDLFINNSALGAEAARAELNPDLLSYVGL